MAITKDSGVRTTGARNLSELSDADRELALAREQGMTKGLRGVDVPNNSPPHDEPHVAPLWIMYGTFAVLILLTAATVGARMVDLGALNIWIALGLAFIKAVLVAMFFMHLFWDSKLNQLILVISLLFLTIFIAAAVQDANEYQPVMLPADDYIPSFNSESTD